MTDGHDLPGAQSRVIVVSLPAEVGAANAGRIGEELSSACASGAPFVVADMTATRCCDSTGVRALARVHRQATANNAELRLAVPSAALRRTFTLGGLMPVFHSLDAALRLGPHAGMRHWWQGLTAE